MPLPLAAMALEGLGAVVVPMLIEAFTGPDGPSPEKLAEMKAIIERESVARATQKGISLDAAREEIKAELGPALEKGFTQEPGVLQSLLTWGGGGIAGAVGGRALGGKLARSGAFGKGQQSKMQAYDLGEEIAKNPTGLSSAYTPTGAKSAVPPRPPTPTPVKGQRLLERESDLGAERDFDVDEYLGAAKPAPAAPVAAASAASPAADDILRGLSSPRPGLAAEDSMRAAGVNAPWSPGEMSAAEQLRRASAPSTTAPVAAAADDATDDAAKAAAILSSDKVTAADLAMLPKRQASMSARDKAKAAMAAKAAQAGGASPADDLIARLEAQRAML